MLTVGKAVEALDESGLLANGVLILSADNGGKYMYTSHHPWIDQSPECVFERLLVITGITGGAGIGGGFNCNCTPNELWVSDAF